MDYKIEKDVPIRTGKKRNGLADLARTMEVGDSFLMHDKVESQAAGISTQLRALSPLKFRVGKEQDSDGKLIGLRVWRMA